jgi:acyl-CoA synthetase (NDP forming)
MNPLDYMLRAGSVAIVGASQRPGSVGDHTLRQLRNGGFGGPIYPVNPGYQSLHGVSCHPDIGEIGEQIDLAVLAVGNEKLEAETEKALAAGARSLAIFASCHGVAADGSPLRARLTSLANDAGVPICGGNGMGFVNVEQSLRICGFYQPDTLTPGGVAFLSHSGSLFSAVLHNKRDLAFNLVVSTGLEQNTRMSDYLNWVLDRESTRVVALFMETIRDPDGFVKGLAKARDREIAVVALKVGASSRGRAAVETHSEAIAGEDAVYEALFDNYDVHRVLTMDEMMDTIELMAAARRPHRGGLGTVHDSGGERALLIDTAERVGVSLPELSVSTKQRVSELLDPGLEPENPIDAWGTGHHFREVFTGCLQALADDPGIGVVAFSVDLTTEETIDEAYGEAAIAVASLTEKPVAVLANLATTVDPMQAQAVRTAGVPVLHGTETGLRAIGHLLDRAERMAWPAPEPRLTGSGAPEWHEPIDVLKSYGISHARTVRVDNREAAASAACDVGYPVVLKTTGWDHKTDISGVITGIDDEGSLMAAFDEMAARLGPEMAVSEQIGPGIEIALGMVSDPQFGPVVLVSAGGTLIELLADRVALLPRVDRFRARRALDRLAVSDLLAGHRGSQRADVDALVDVIARFSELVADSAGSVESIDLNPVIVGRDSAVAVDVLVRVPR